MERTSETKDVIGQLQDGLENIHETIKIVKSAYELLNIKIENRQEKAAEKKKKVVAVGLLGFSTTRRARHQRQKIRL